MSATDTISSLLSSNSSASSSSSSSSESVFGDSYHYIPTAKSLLYDSDFRQKTYFQLGDAPTSSSTTSGTSNNAMSGLLTSSSSSSSSSSTSASFSDTDFWELILTQYEETHTEKYTPYNTLSEAFAWVATGPTPVEVSLTGMLMMSGSSDYRTKFLYNYTAAFRAKQLSSNEKTLTLVVKDTTMKLLLTSLSLNETADSPDFIGISMTGQGYKYKNTNSSEELYRGYYGTAEKVPTSSASSSSTAKKEETATKETGKKDESSNIVTTGVSITGE